MNPLKSLLACLVLTAGSTSIPSLLAVDPASADAFLDRPLPADVHVGTVSAPAPEGDGSMKDFPMLRVPSFWGGVQLLGAMSGKAVRLPKELAEWPGERTEDNWGMSLGVPKDGKVRELFERLCLTLGVGWRYDAKEDVIELAPEWKRGDPRPGKELVGVLLGIKPATQAEMQHDDKPNRVGGHSLKLDAWRLAFDALLSRPENFASAGSVRLYHGSHGHERGMSLHVVDNLYAGRLLAPDGHTQILVLNRQRMGTIKDNPGDLAYYLFDEDGKFTQGGVYAVAPGRQGWIASAQVRDQRTVSVAVDLSRRANEADSLHFTLVDGDLVLQGSTDPQGKERTAEETRADYPVMGGTPQEILRQEYHVTAAATK